MVKEITSIDMDKYLVIKKEDLRKLPDYLQRQQSLINTEIRFNRIAEGKKEWPKHLVLNMDDEIDLQAFFRYVEAQFQKPIYWWDHKKIENIAVSLINSILRAREG